MKMQSSSLSHSLGMWVQNGTATLDNSLLASCNAKHSLTICSNNHTHRCLTDLKTYDHTNLHENVYTLYLQVSETGSQPLHGCTSLTIHLPTERQ